MKRIMVLLMIIAFSTGCIDSYQNGYDRGKHAGRMEGLNVCESRLDAMNDQMNRILDKTAVK